MARVKKVIDPENGAAPHPQLGDRYLWHSGTDGRCLLEVASVTRTASVRFRLHADVWEPWDLIQKLPLPASFQRVHAVEDVPR